LNGCRVGEIAEARLAREELGLRPVRLTDERLFYLNLAQFNPYGLFALTTGLNVGLDDTLFIDDLLKVMQEEVVVGV
jgi:hypothetical protein